MRSWQVAMFVSIAVWNLNKTGHLLLVCLLLNLIHTVHMNLELVTEVTPYGSNLLTCRYIGTRTVTSVGWYIGSNSSVPLILEPGGLDAKCDIHSDIPPGFDGYKINYTCDAAKNNYTVEIKQKTSRDDAVLMICAILEPLPREEAYVTIYFNESTTTASTPESTTTASTPGDHQSDELGRRLGIGLGIGIPVFVVIIIGGIVICIVIFFKTKVIIENKDTLQRPRPAKKKMIITAKISGCWISSVEWIKEKEILHDGDNYSIVPYDGKTKGSSLIIKNLSRTEHETYFCLAKGRFGYSTQDSITLPPDKKKQRKEKTGSSPVQSTEKKENPLEESKQKRRKTKKKKGQMSDRNPEKDIEESERLRPIHTGTSNKVESNTTSKETNERLQPLPPVGGVVKKKPKSRPQPPTPENTDIKDQNQRRLSANPDGMQDMATETHRSSRLPPIQVPLQSTLKVEVSPEEPKKKRRRKKRKKDLTNDTKNDVEMKELSNTRESLEFLIVPGEG